MVTALKTFLCWRWVFQAQWVISKGSAGNSASVALPEPGADNSLSNNEDILIDGIRPEIILISFTSPDGTYSIGEVINVQATFDDIVSVTGTPVLELETGISDAFAIYSSGSGQSTLNFTYVVGPGESTLDLDVNNINSFLLDNSFVLDENGNDANVLVPEPGTEGSLSSTRAIVVDGIRPTVITVTSPTPDGSYGIGDTIVIETLFSEPVFVDGVPEIQLASGENMGFATYISGTGTDVLSFEYTISEGDTSSDLVYNDTTFSCLSETAAC